MQAASVSGRMVRAAPVRAARFIQRCGLALALALAGCAMNASAPQGGGPLPLPGAQLGFHAAPAAASFAQVTTAPMAERTVYRGAGATGTGVEIRDLIIGPNATVQLAPFPGPAVLDRRSGEGALLVAGSSVALSAVKPASVPAGATVSIQNTASAPLVIRAYVLEGQ